MSDLYNFQLTSSDNEDKDQEIPQQKENFGFHKIKHIVHKNNAQNSKKDLQPLCRKPSQIMPKNYPF